MHSIKLFFMRPDLGVFLLRIFIGLATLAQGLILLKAGPGTWKDLGEAMQYFGFQENGVYWGLLATLVQVVGPLFFILGLFFRTACFFLFSVMLVAFLYHWFAGDPIVQVGSHAAKMAALFFCFMFIGPGAYSIRE